MSYEILFLCYLTMGIGLYAIEVAGMLIEEDFQKCKEFGYTYKIPAESKYSTMWIWLFLGSIPILDTFDTWAVHYMVIIRM